MIKIIAHRGNFQPEGPIPEVMNKYSIPENTMEAFHQAFKKGWGIETDIKLTGDGTFVVIHDNNLERFADNPGIIDQMSVDEIRQVGYKTNPQFKIPTLEDLCQIANGVFISEGKKVPFIAFQVKRGSDPQSGVKVGRAVAEIMRKYNLTDSILFDATVEEAQVLHSEFPWLNLSVSVGEKNYSSTIYTPDQALSPEFRSIFSSIWADEWKIHGSIYNKKLFTDLKNAYPDGRIDVISPELHYNEKHPLAKDPEGLKKLWKEIISWDTANGICTDYPTILQSILPVRVS